MLKMSENTSVEMLNGREVLFDRIGENVEFVGIDFLGLDNDFEECEEILSISDYSAIISPEDAYTTRKHHNLLGTYKIKVESIKGYKDFVEKLEHLKSLEKSLLLGNIRKISREIDDLLISQENVSHGTIETLKEKLVNAQSLYNNSKELAFVVSYDEWKNNKLNSGKKLSKELVKRFNGMLLEYYNAQKRTGNDKTYYFTITDLPQHIVGMSYYSTGDWCGMNGSSCMNPQNDYEACVQLAGALHDDKLLIGFLHENLIDLEDMEGKALGRTVFRHITPKTNLVEGFKFDREMLIATKYYTNYSGVMENAILELESLNIGIVSNNVIYDRFVLDSNDYISLSESSNGSYLLEMSDDVYISENYNEEVEVECVACGGSGDFEVYSSRLDKEISVTCPACSGSGTLYSYIEIEIDEWVEVEDETEITPYNEGYSVGYSSITMKLDKDYLRKVLGNN